ncbi:uncharacterized protein BBA_08481 [Beauveria bassiana ARSEF 2860]|uniref:Uncharacterized protein n=1 Tax=Beauveria bassiana (strain ARSEF 2860) TaxID=655819 RepID=J4VVU5_BEAB2|nr:uncharacterized protein BBA_08481 [Beauveria bassiana ARSEF 2860]EJP62570.1 hypothetical protein BBA_08481 [Beauveria bassiana ARSEF 2860]
MFANSATLSSLSCKISRFSGPSVCQELMKRGRVEIEGVSTVIQRLSVFTLQYKQLCKDLCSSYKGIRTFNEIEKAWLLAQEHGQLLWRAELPSCPAGLPRGDYLV